MTATYFFIIVGMLAASPNVVFLSVDTLRADYLGFYGFEHNTSPNLDRLAAESLVFDDCICEVPLTAPSFGSMLTSRFPRMTGLTRNGLRMPADVPTVVESFRAAGYFTFCVQSNWTLKSELSGLDRGFDVYEDDFHKKRWGIVKSERYADEVTRIALEQLDTRNTAKPFFAWIHYSDPHAPYELHRDHRPIGGGLWFKKNRDKVRIKYASEVAFTDACIGTLLDALPRENTVIVFVADHGESLYEHDYLGHGRRIYRTEVRIPFMIHAAGIAPGRSNAPVRGIDLGPTLLGLAALAPVAGMLGRDILHDVPEPNRVRVFETYGGAVPKLPGVHALMADKAPMRQGAILEGWKLILGGSQPELFYLPDDPGELNDLSAAEPERLKELQGLIETWDKRTGRGTNESASLNADDVSALEALGYVE